MSVARFGEVFTSRSLEGIDLGDEIYVGLYVCSHRHEINEKGLFKNVRLIRPAKDSFVPYRDYIGSDLELLDVKSGDRRIIHHVGDSLQAPNWTPDGKTLLCNRNGRMYSWDLASGKSVRLADRRTDPLQQ